MAIIGEVLVHDALEEMYDTEFHFEIVVDNVQLFSAAAVYAELCRYATFTYLDVVATITSFAARWTQWCTQQGPDLKRAYDALRQTYDPLANYDMTEESSDGAARDKDTDTVTPSGTSTTTSNADRWGYDSGTGVPTDSVTTTQSYTDYEVSTDRAHDNTLTSDDLSGAYNEVRDHKLTRKGNIGITSSQQLALAEVQLRQQDLLESFCKRFINKWYSLLHGGVDV